MSARDLIDEFHAGVEGQADIDLSNVVWLILEDVLDSVRLAARDARTDDPAAEIVQTVEDYIANTYGDL